MRRLADASGPVELVLFAAIIDLPLLAMARHDAARSRD
jgi:hypothetical protein